MQDNGPGIDEHDLAHIFEMFYRANPKKGGTGLGLYIAYEAAAKLGGRLSVQSTLGQGTTFTLEIPKVTSGY